MSEGVEDAAADARMLEGISQRARQIEPLLKTTARHKDALKLVLADPPIATRNEDVKDRNAALVSAVVTAIRDEAVAQEAVDALTSDEQDVLMKYIYRGLKKNVDQSAVWLRWHGIVHRKTGVASIVRVLTDRKGV